MRSSENSVARAPPGARADPPAARRAERSDPPLLRGAASGIWSSTFDSCTVTTLVSYLVPPELGESVENGDVVPTVPAGCWAAAPRPALADFVPELRLLPGEPPLVSFE